MMNLKNITCFVLLGLNFCLGQDLLPSNELTEKRKLFWVKIFTEYSDDFTIIHDSEIPELIYDVVEHKGYEHFKRIRRVKSRLELVRKKLLKQISYDHIPAELKNIKGYKLLSERVRYQQGMSNRFLEGLNKSMLYINKFKEMMECSSIPAPKELAFLPHIESSFNDQAYSKVKAAGMWQLMPKVAKYYKLRVEATIDERLDPLKATEVAVKLLCHNFKQVGSWPLAITAYNHGASNIVKAIKKVGSLDFAKVLDANESESFQFASKNFYPSFLAAVWLSNNFSNKFFSPYVPVKRDWKVKKLTKAVTLAEILKVLGISKEELKKLNPHLLKKFWKEKREKKQILPKGTWIYY
jgi:membrane-bound lytic murein transglycosylase D